MKPLTNFDLIDYAKELKIPHFRGVFMRDMLPKRIRVKECCILNLNTSQQNGSHWVAYYKNAKDRVYFDSFGCITPIELQQYMKTKTEFVNNINCIQRNTEQIQKPNTNICGHLCLYVLKTLSNDKNFQSIINSLY